MANALAVRNTDLTENPAGLGSKQAIVAVRDRIMSMMPGAASAPPDVVWAAAQLAVAYKLDPFNGEIYIMKIGSRNVDGRWVDDYRAHVGIKGLRKKAREQAQFMTEFRDLSPEEVKLARRGDHDEGDIGVECTLWRLDIAQQCARLNIPYKPFKATGFWRVKAQFRRKDNKWEPDGIPNTWTAHDVAEKRAEINAIKRAYDLTIDVADPSAVDDDNTVEVIGHRIASHDRDHAGFVERNTQPDTTDGDILFYSETSTAPIDAAVVPDVYEVELVIPVDVANWLNQASPVDAAKAWAIDVGACANEHEAKNSLKKIVDTHGGRLNKSNLNDVLVAFHDRQLEKLAEMAADAETEAAEDEAVDVPFDTEPEPAF